MIRSHLTRSLASAALLALAGTVGASHTAAAQSLLYGIGGTDTGAGPNAAAYTLFSFQSSTPGTTTTVGTVTATTGYALESIAFQPTTGNLYGYQFNTTTNQGQLVTINRATGALATLGSPVTIGSISGSNGNSATISFNPSNGAIRLVTGTNGNFRFNAATGALLGQDANVAYASGDPNVNNTFQISGVAYTSGAALYDVDNINNVLATQNLSTGALTTVGTLGFTATQGSGSEGFTIGSGNVAFLNSTNSGQGGAVRDNLYSVNLTTGAATSLGLIGGSATFNTVDIAAFVVPEPGTYALCGLSGAALVVLAARRRHAV